MEYTFKKLPDICRISTGKHDANHATSNGMYRFYTCANQYCYCNTKSFSGEAVIVPGNGDIGLVFYYNGDFDAYQRTYVLTDISIYAKYLYYHMLYKWRHVNSGKQFGSTVKYVRMGNFSSYELPVPPVPEQERIVAKIEELFSQLDVAVAELKSIKEKLAIYRHAVMQNVIVQYTQDVPNVFIKDVCNEIKVGIVIKPSQYYTTLESGIKAFRSANVREFYIDDKDWVFLSKDGHLKNKRSEVHIGDVLIVRSGYPGTACVVTEKFDGSNAIDVLIAVPNREKIASEYLCAYTNSPLGKKLVADKKRGVAQAHLNVGGYSKISIPIPEILVQNIIVEEIHQKVSICNNIEQTVDTALQQAAALRQSILKQAFEGNL